MSAEAKLWEVFVRARRGVSHVHCGTLRAHDSEQALQRARDLFTRRLEGVSLWVAPSACIIASQPEESQQFFAPAEDKIYRDPTHYEVPTGVTTI
ncbi:MAG: 1,2-phenylacetyl-CoA epoxidase subunit PaaB [Hyphomonadaceae bacterium]